jgi:hypothetical protein
MKSFTEFVELEEGASRHWIVPLALAWAMNVGRIEEQVHRTTDVAAKLDLIATQNKLAAYLSAANIAVGIDDRGLVARLRGKRR